MAKKYTPVLKEKRWNHKLEKDIFGLWEREGVFRFRLNNNPIFTIDTPPPYVSGRWHIGAAVHYTQIDMVARYFRLQGYNVLFPMGLDRNGLPVEIEVEKVYNVKAKDMDREEFIRLCKSHLDKLENELIELAKRLGIGAEYYDHLYRTDAESFRALTQATFIELWKKGLIYEDYRPTIWCPVCDTTIAEAEIEYVSRKGKLYYIRFPLKGVDKKYIVIATTRPELVGATSAVMYNPKDDRYQWLKGKEAIIPIYNYTVPIIPHPIVKIDFGTGLMMLSSFGDLEDVRLFRELGYTARVLIDRHGRMNENAGPYKGLTVEEAREAIVADLYKNDFIEKEEEIDQNIPTCWRSHNPVEFIFTKDLYLKQLEFKNELLEVSRRMKFFPKHSFQILENWINSLSIDWAISRHRYYSTEVPIWYCKSCGHPNLPPPGPYYRPWKEPPPFEKCEKCGGTEFIGDERTFDTWMDSSVSPLYISGYGKNQELFKRTFPVSLRPQGIDIVRTWLYYTILRIYLLMNTAPFKMVRLSGMGLDEKGRAMSKSLGNIVDPMPLIEKYGADAVRLWGASETKLGGNYRFSEDRVDGARKFITKLWNVARFISMFPEENKINELCYLDRLIIHETNNLIEVCRKSYEELDFFEAANRIRSFIWNVFAPHYIELVKNRAYNINNKFTEQEQLSAWYTLHHVLKVILLLLHPITPFITDYIWRQLYNEKGIYQEQFPSLSKVKIGDVNLKDIMELDYRIWKYKQDNGIPIKGALDSITLHPKFKVIARELQTCHNIKEINYNESIDLLKIS